MVKRQNVSLLDFLGRLRERRADSKPEPCSRFGERGRPARCGWRPANHSGGERAHPSFSETPRLGDWPVRTPVRGDRDGRAHLQLNRYGQEPVSSFRFRIPSVGSRWIKNPCRPPANTSWNSRLLHPWFKLRSLRSLRFLGVNRFPPKQTTPTKLWFAAFGSVKIRVYPWIKLRPLRSLLFDHSCISFSDPCGNTPCGSTLGSNLRALVSWWLKPVPAPSSAFGVECWMFDVDRLLPPDYRSLLTAHSSLNLLSPPPIFCTMGM